MIKNILNKEVPLKKETKQIVGGIFFLLLAGFLTIILIIIFLTFTEARNTDQIYIPVAVFGTLIYLCLWAGSKRVRGK